MAAHDAGEHQLGVGARLAEPPSAALVSSFGAELEFAHVLYEGLGYADLAHTVMLMEAGLIPQPAGVRLLHELVALHDLGIGGIALEAKWGDIYNNRDAELQRRLGDGAGWLHVGRARREALNLGWLLHVRNACHRLLGVALAFVETLTRLAEQHTETVMPDFTYLQHAQPTTLGHFVLGFAYPVVRDVERLLREVVFFNRSPAGSASTNGSRLPLNRDRIRALLGFDDIVVHCRDAMWEPDLPINLMGVLVSLVTTADRLTEELQLWSTAEFGFMELADRHCRTSVIMPQKKNPYALAFIRGKARETDGQLVSVITTNQTPSGQLDNRNASYELVPRALATTTGIMRLLAEVVEAARFDRSRMRTQAETGCTWGTDLVDMLMQREHIDSRTAHEIVGSVVAHWADAGTSGLVADLDRAFRARVGHEPTANLDEIAAELVPDRIVQDRCGVGSCAPASVRAMANDLRDWSARINDELELARARSNFPSLLRHTVAQHLGGEDGE
ncbi:MAG: lyase family protein [Candidatus Binatia bacterium]|jgi:argininosuccinate lyase